MPSFHAYVRKLSHIIGVTTGFAMSLLSIAGGAFASETQTTQLGVGAKTLRLVGAETALRLSSSSEAVGALGGQLVVTTNNSLGCTLSAKVDQTGDTVVITLSKSGYQLSWWCDPELTLVVPPQMNLSVAVDKMVADMRGDFAAIDIASSKSVINFVGRASRFHLRGVASITRLSFAHGIKAEDVDISVPMMLSHVSFEDE